MFTIKDVEEIRKLMKKFNGQGDHLVYIPDKGLQILNKHTGKLSKLPDGKEIFDK